MTDNHKTIEAVWKIESTRLVAAIAGVALLPRGREVTTAKPDSNPRSNFESR